VPDGFKGRRCLAFFFTRGRKFLENSKLQGKREQGLLLNGQNRAFGQAALSKMHANA